jgi:PKD repeat protein
MTDTTTEPETEPEEEVPEPQEVSESADNTELVLWTWGLSGEPVTWASLEQQPVITQIRLVNTGFSDASSVQNVLDAQYPDKGYDAANVTLAHPPSAEFTATVTDLSVRVDLADDADLGLPDDYCRWDWGDGTTTNDAGGYDHEYDSAGSYEIRCTIPVAGVSYSTTQVVEVGDVVAVEPTVDPAYAERAATVFESETDDQPNNSVPEEPDADEPVEEDGEEITEEIPVTYDPADYTVDEVLAYAADHPDEIDDIRVAEEAGKNRSTLLDKL